jgi:hypothetical protein
VNGDVHVHEGATLVMQYSIARGNLDCNGCASLTVNPATILGNLHSDHAGATTIISSAVGGDLGRHRRPYDRLPRQQPGSSPLLPGAVPADVRHGPSFLCNDAPDLKGQCSVFGLGPQGPPGP